MTDSLDINSSADLLNEFLGQQDGAPEVTDQVLNDRTEDEVEGVDKITPKPPVATPDNTELGIINELPEGFETEETEKETTETTPTKDTESNYSFKALAGFLSEEGIIDFEDSTELQDTPEVLFESVKNTIAKEIQSYKDSIPEKAKNLIEYIEKGGDVDSYLTAIQKPFDLTTLDLTSESDQEKAVREYFKIQEYTQEEIDETIKDYKDSLILDKQAKVATKQLQKYFDKREELVLAEQAEQAEAQKAAYSNYITQVSTKIDTAETLAGLPLTAKEKTEFKKYLLAVDKEGLTGYAKEVAEDPVQTQVELAYLKFKKYNFANAVKAGESAAAKKFKEIFKSNETTIKTGKSSEEVASSGLDAFAAFRGKSN